MITDARRGESWLPALLITLPPLVYWLALAPVILWLGSRVSPRRSALATVVLVHAAAAAAVSALYAELMIHVIPQLTPGSLAVAVNQSSSWAIRFQIGLFSYSFLLSWGWVHEYFTAVRERDVRVARLETELAQAQLRALKAQLQPHFLFNTLHAVTVLIRRDPEAAGRMVMRLSDLLRMTLVDAERQETTLERELTFVRLYLEIEQTRFRERLQVGWEVGAGLEQAAVPTLLLQPLVENALRHGVEARAGVGRVTIAVGRDDGLLVLRVSDNGPGPGPAAGEGRGIGLASTRGRLERLYGEAHRFAIAAADAGGTSVMVGIPFRRLEGRQDG